MIDLPVFTVELRDIPRMIRSLGESLLGIPRSVNELMRLARKYKKPAEHYLNYQFGWKPLISDLLQLTKFQKAVTQRTNELKSLKGGTLRRNVNLVKQSATFAGSRALNSSNGVAVAGTVATRTDRKRWFSCKWIHQNPALLPNTDEEMVAEATRIILGLRYSPASLWQAMPWSWLADYFANMGDYLAAYRNVEGITPGSGCLMTSTVTTSSCKAGSVSKPGVTCSSGKSTMTTLIRVPTAVDPIFQSTLPFLSGEQLSILTALTITRL